MSRFGQKRWALRGVPALLPRLERGLLEKARRLTALPVEHVVVAAATAAEDRAAG